MRAAQVFFRAARQRALPLAIGLLVGAGIMHGVHGQMQTQTEAVKRSPLYTADLTGVEGKEVHVTLLEAAPGVEIPPHSHSGDEFSYVIEGAIETFVEKEAAPVQAGGVFHAAREKVHGGKVTSDTPAKVLAVYVVDKGKPLAQPAGR